MKSKKFILLVAVVMLLINLVACRAEEKKSAEAVTSSKESGQEKDSDQSEKENSEPSTNQLAGPKGSVDYESATKEFKKMSITEAVELVKTRDFVLYIGGIDCPFCVDFVPVLNSLRDKHALEVIYVDSADANTPEFVQFMEEQDFNTIPTLFQVKEGELKRITLNLPYMEEELEKLLGLAAK